jgi:hypothetical protein
MCIPACAGDQLQASARKRRRTIDVKDAQGILRHSRASTTQDVYQQVVPESQRRAVRKLTSYVQRRSGSHVLQMQESKSVSEVQPMATKSGKAGF